MRSFFQKTALILFLLIAVYASASAQCAMCKGAAETALKQGEVIPRDSIMASCTCWRCPICLLELSGSGGGRTEGMRTIRPLRRCSTKRNSSEFFGGGGFLQARERFPYLPAPPGSQHWSHNQAEAVVVERTLQIKMNKVHNCPSHAASRTFKIQEPFGRAHCRAIVEIIWRQYERNDRSQYHHCYQYTRDYFIFSHSV